MKSKVSPDIHNESKSRRTALSVLGTAGLGLIATAAQALPVKTTRAATLKIYRTVEEMVSDKSLKDGMYAQTLGYFTPGDNGGCDYEITKRPSDDGELHPGSLSVSDIQARVIHRGFVNYRMFGAKSDGSGDDGVAIKAAHEYANSENIPVINLSGEYWIRETRNISISTDVNWGASIFYIDEQKNIRGESNFLVRSNSAPIEINLTVLQKSALLKKLKPGVKLIPELADYKNHLIVIQDANDRIGVRAGAKYNASSWAKEELFYVEEMGYIVGDIAWEFNDYTKLTAYPADNHYLTIEGGVFYLSGDNPGQLSRGYYAGGIATRRSRTIIRNQWVGLSKGKQDISLTPRAGFYTFNYVYDVLLENIRLIPWEQDRTGTDRDLLAGTYGIGGSRILNATFRNVTAEGSLVHWGVFGTNLNKNFTIENCRLNRIDVHFHCWNIAIRNCTIGMRGISITGGGELLVENTTVNTNHFINFRTDYGAKWDGPIRISNCRLSPVSLNDAQILYFAPANFNYQYPIGFGHQIIVSNFTFDFRTVPASNGNCWLIKFPAFSETKEEIRLFFPNHIDFRNVFVTGREKGIRMFALPDVSGFKVVSGEGSLGENGTETNSNFHFEHIQLEKQGNSSSSPLSHLLLNIASDKTYKEVYALFPAITVLSCQHFSGIFGEIAANIRIENSSISRFSAGDKKPFRGIIAFNNCSFNANTNGEDPELFPIYNSQGVHFTNCVVSAPTANGQSKAEYIDRVSFLKLNKSVRFNHLNTRLSPAVLQYCKQKNIILNPKFIAMLKAHHELESETL